MPLALAANPVVVLQTPKTTSAALVSYETVNNSLFLEGHPASYFLSSFTELDPIWTSNFTAMQSSTCDAGNYSYGINADGTFMCRDDLQGAGSGGSFNQTYDDIANAWNGNYSALFGSLNNESYLTTYNETYALWAYNQTEAAFTIYNSTWDNSYMNVWNYNQTDATNTQYGSEWYNHTSAFIGGYAGCTQYQVLQSDGAGNIICDWVHAH